MTSEISGRCKRWFWRPPRAHGEVLNLTCAVHLRQEHGFKRWQTSRFLETYPWLIREDGTFAFAALHRLVHVMVHVEEAAVPLDESGTVAFVRLIKPSGVTDHLHP